MRKLLDLAAYIVLLIGIAGISCCGGKWFAIACFVPVGYFFSRYLQIQRIAEALEERIKELKERLK